MKLNVLPLALYLSSAFNAFAAAQVEERELKQSAVESAQLKANFTRNQARDAEQQLREAELELAEAERANQDARQRASAAVRRLEDARAALARAKAGRVAAGDALRRATEEVNRESTQRGRAQ